MTDVLGSILTVGITVVVTAGFVGTLLVLQPAPLDTLHVDVTITVGPGDAGWASGDELVTLRHTGGEPLPRDTATIHILAGATATTLAGGSLDDGFSDGQLTIGESWDHVMDIAGGSTIAVTLVSMAGEGQVVAASALSIPAQDCSGDSQAPTVTLWAQVPTDVTTATPAAIVVTATITDNCSGVDSSQPPVLRYLVGPITPPPFGSSVTLTQTGSQWTGTIPMPAPDWLAHYGETLQYYVDDMRDNNGNVADSAVQADLVQISGASTFVNVFTPSTGTVVDPANAQSATDSGAEARLVEANNAGGSATNGFNANTVVNSGTGWTTGTNGFDSDDIYATNSNSNPGTIRYGHRDQAGNPGPITAVVLKAEVSISPVIDDAWRLQACVSGTCSAASANILGSLTDAIIAYDVTALNPLSPGGPWSWTDVNALDTLVVPVKVGVARDGTWRIDRVWLEVNYSPSPTYALSATADFALLPPGTLNVLEVQYRVQGETFRVQVWDGLAWVDGTPDLTSVSSTYWSRTLSVAEVAAGPLIRFVDVNPGGATQGTLYLDYVRVVTA